MAEIRTKSEVTKEHAKEGGAHLEISGGGGIKGPGPLHVAFNTMSSKVRRYGQHLVGSRPLHNLRGVGDISGDFLESVLVARGYTTDIDGAIDLRRNTTQGLNGALATDTFIAFLRQQPGCPPGWQNRHMKMAHKHLKRLERERNDITVARIAFPIAA